MNGLEIGGCTWVEIGLETGKCTWAEIGLNTSWIQSDVNVLYLGYTRDDVNAHELY